MAVKREAAFCARERARVFGLRVTARVGVHRTRACPTQCLGAISQERPVARI